MFNKVLNNKGFTIIELMISMSIFAFMITGLTIALVHQQRQFTMTKELGDMDQMGRGILDFIATDIRNAGSRQGKTFSLTFVNGGSQPNAGCAATDTTDDGTQDSPPDCLNVFTWDISRGIDGEDLPSVAADVVIVPSSKLIIQIPQEWVPGGDPILEEGDLIGFKARLNLCTTSATIDCTLNPESCTECAAVLKVTHVHDERNPMQIDFEDSVDRIIAQNIQGAAYTDFKDFADGDFTNKIATQFSEMTIVRSTTFSINTLTNEFQVDEDLLGSPTPFAGGFNSPGVMDIQFVFNLQNTDGSMTKVGVPTNTGKNMFSSFSEDPTLMGRQQDIRTVEIYVLVRSKMKPHLKSGKKLEKKTIVEIGDRLERLSDHSSLDDGYVYKIYSTTVYVRNFGREEFG